MQRILEVKPLPNVPVVSLLLEDEDGEENRYVMWERELSNLCCDGVGSWEDFIDHLCRIQLEGRWIRKLTVVH